MLLSGLILGTTDGGNSGQDKDMCQVCHMFCILFCYTIVSYCTGPVVKNNILWNDDNNDELPKGSGLRKRAAGTMMETEVEFIEKVTVMTMLLLRGKIGCHHQS